MGEAQARIARNVKLPPGYHIEWAGELGNLDSAVHRLDIVVPISLVLILVLLYANFGSIRDTLLAFTVIPMTIVGGVAALALTGTPFSISAAIGFIALFGVAVQNGVIIVSYMMQKHDEGLSSEAAAVEGVRVRLRPVVMTAMVGMVGFLPLLLSDGTGAELQRPLATVVIGGLFTATFLTLVVLPSIYALINHAAPKHKDIGVV